jgi:hypothetical protein
MNADKTAISVPLHCVMKFVGHRVFMHPETIGAIGTAAKAEELAAHFIRRIPFEPAIRVNKGAALGQHYLKPVS